MSNTSVRFLAHCQICGNEQKVRNGRMVSHGYQRPWEGSGNMGDCGGVGHVPYEVSCDRLKELVVEEQSHQAALNESIAQLKSGAVTEIRVYWTEGFGRNKRQQSKLAQKVNCVEHEWDAHVRGEVIRFERLIKNSKSAVLFFNDRISSWKPGTVKETTEAVISAEKRKVQSDRSAAKKAERTAKKAEASEKQKTAAEKRKVAEAEQEVARQGFIQQIKELAAKKAAGGNVSAAALELARKMGLKKNFNWLIINQLGVNDELLALGLAKVSKNHMNLGKDYLCYVAPLQGGQWLA